MKRSIFLLTMWLLFLLTTSCYRDFHYDADDFSSHIVLHSFVEADSAIHVNVSKSWLIGEEPSDSVLDGANISLFVNDEPKDLATATPRGGDHLHLVVEADGLQTVEATTLVPEKVKIKQVDYAIEGENNYYTFQLKISFQDPLGEPNYYAIGVCPLDSLVSFFYLDVENDPLFSGLTTGNILNDLLFLSNRLVIQTYPFPDDAIESMEYTLNISLYLRYDFIDEEKTDGAFSICLYSLSESYYKYILSLSRQGINHISEYGLADPNLTYRNVKNGLGVLVAYQMDTVQIHFPIVRSGSS